MRKLLLFTFILAPLMISVTARAQSPSVDYHALLTAVKALDNGSLVLDDFVTVFLPEDAFYTGGPNEKPRVFLSLNKGGEKLSEIPHILYPMTSVFGRAQAYGAPPAIQIPGPGEYELRVTFDSTVIAMLPFKANFIGGDDPFKPDKKMVVDGPWSQLAGLIISDPGDPEQQVEVTLWPQASKNEQENFDVQIHFRGQVIYETRQTVVSTRNPVRSELKLKFPKAGGGDWVKLKDFVKQDGTYELVVRKNGQESSRFSYAVSGGKITPLARSAFSFEPHDAFLCPKHARYRGSIAGLSDVYWAELGSGPAPDAPVASASGPSAADLDRWQVKPTHDPNRPFSMNLSPVAARFDAALAAGDGVIAFGTGGFKGVAYMNVGDSDSRSIPDGQNYRAGFIKVAGKKIILVNGKNVAVFDTVSGTLSKIPDSEIQLALPVKGMHEANPLDASGYLVATINDASKVTDRAVVKLIDVSGPEPVVFGLSNADFQGREATSIAVDAGSGLVAVSSQRKNAIYTAIAAPGAALDKHDLSAHDGVESAPLIADSGLVAYRDDAGKAKFRILDPANGKIHAIGTLGPSLYGYMMNAGNYAYATVDGYGSDYAIVTAKAPAAASAPAGTGDSMKAGNGKLGYGQSIAIAPDGTVFIAGAGKSGLGSGEFLMALTAGAWKEMLGADEKALPACDVTIGNGLLAFKSGTRNDTAIAYATFGSSISP